MSRFLFYGALALCLVAGWAAMIRMPGCSAGGPLPPLSPREAALREELRRDVTRLAGEIGERNLLHEDALNAAADFVEGSLAAAGYPVRQQEYQVAGTYCRNLEAGRPGSDRVDEIVVIGAHYDSVAGSPGANDNATGTAALLALARAFAAVQPSRTLRFVAFVNEEPPYFQTPAMGSVVYARRCRERGERLAAMLSLETIGYYADAPDSQQYPFPFNLFYPSTGNFIGFVGNLASGRLVRQVIASFRRHARVPSEGIATFAGIPGVGWSDQWAFWQEGYPAVMVTDTALFRDPAYHSPMDTPERLDYDRLARVVAGLERVVAELVGASPH